mgnify:CR=1 FL=1
MKRILIQRDGNGMKMALTDDGALMEYDAERHEDRRIVGNIYLGRVRNVLPGMQAACVDIGTGKNAYLYRDELLPVHLEQRPKQKPSIEQLVSEGQHVLVQITKEGIGKKGPRVSAQISLPGRWLVYMPEADYVAVSRKIASDEEKARLKKIGEELRQEGEGLILRTVSEGEAKESLEADLLQLRERWNRIKELKAQSKAPCELYSELDLALRTARDLFSSDIDEFICDDPMTADQVRRFVQAHDPALAGRIRLHQDELPLFERYGVDREVRRVFQNRHPLKSGGSLVVDFTEALTVFDVNTGKFTGSTDLEETIVQTNLEAADAIARILRLRDIGGIIIIDFIDMEKSSSREQVLQRMKELAARDRSRTVVVGWTGLGLLEMTRKKIRASDEDKPH